jgi:hypothetical protein
MDVDHHSVFGCMVVLATTAKTKCFANVIPERFGKPNVLDTDVSFVMGVSITGNRSVDCRPCPTSNSQYIHANQNNKRD